MGTECCCSRRLDRVLPTEDADISKIVGRGLAKQNITIHTGTLVENVQAGEDKVSCASGDQSSAGGRPVHHRRRPRPGRRGPRARGRGREARRQGPDRRRRRDETSAKGVYAIGDLDTAPRSRTRHPTRAHRRRGRCRPRDHPIEYIDIPRATFCTPNVGSFGLTEEQAREQGMDVDGRQGPVRRRRRRHRLRRSQRHHEDHRRQEVRRDGRRPHRRLARAELDPGAREREGPRGRLSRRSPRIIHGHPTLSEAIMEAARAADGWLIHG